ncbi:hypothetical protein E1161_14275 [Saccharopolyspora aridisoli]|uniref:Uncharacterized protein n=1 Tax=Saccharopolyspora aridisoli TaxID=2530385 RepID=A0A4V2Y7K6_9PSEU|nr:hypothetical protein E1161_14275 [Saccharopolyspora aridisoli]
MLPVRDAQGNRRGTRSQAAKEDSRGSRAPPSRGACLTHDLDQLADVAERLVVDDGPERLTARTALPLPEACPNRRGRTDGARLLPKLLPRPKGPGGGDPRRVLFMLVS